jgi:C4-dicarboxylate-specific signal transduction histidine kinase
VLCSNGKVAGTFCIYHREARDPTSQDLELIELATHVARVAIERDQQEISLREAQNELAHVNRVTTLGEFAASIAHEVNQPLAGILTNAHAALLWLAGDSPNFAEAQQTIGRIIRDGNRAGDVVSRMRALFKKAPAAKEPLDINLVIQEVLMLTQAELKKSRLTADRIRRWPTNHTGGQDSVATGHPQFGCERNRSDEWSSREPARTVREFAENHRKPF